MAHRKTERNPLFAGRWFEDDIILVSFVSVTQQFNTTTSMGRLTLNVLLSFAQFEREVTGECIRDKIAASKKKKGMWMGGNPPLGYDVKDKRGHPVNGEVERGSAVSGSQIWFPVRLSI